MRQRNHQGRRMREDELQKTDKKIPEGHRALNQDGERWLPKNRYWKRPKDG